MFGEVESPISYEGQRNNSNMMSKEELEDGVMTQQKAELLIGETRDYIATFGSNDVEIPALNRLLDGVVSGEIDPQLAWDQAHAIRVRKESSWNGR